MDYQVGDIITFKKQHPCGSKNWIILRTGADCQLKCEGCGDQLMMPRTQVQKNTKEIHKNT